MEFPEGLTEADAIDAIEYAVVRLAKRYAFGYHDVDDIKQFGRMFGLNAVARWDGKRPFSHFVYVHIKNRLSNLKRDKLRRTDAPCAKCHAGELCQDDGDFCPAYREWYERNQAKANIMQPMDLGNVGADSESRMRLESHAESDAETAELLALIDMKLPVRLRAAYLKMRAGVPVSRDDRAEIEECVRGILGGPDADADA